MSGEIPKWFKQKPNTLKYHLAHPEITPDNYTRNKRIALGQRLMSKKRIYFDTKHWLHFRDVVLGRPRTKAHVHTLDKLKILRQRDLVISPVSYSVFVELQRQSDDETKRATAKVIDMLSGGTCIQPPDELFRREVMHFIRRILTPNIELHPIGELVWTKVVFILGDRFLHAPLLGKANDDAMQKAMDDMLWELNLEEMISMLPTDNPDEAKATLTTFAGELTQGKRTAAKDSETFDELFDHEVAGTLEGHVEMLEELMLHACRISGYKGEASASEKAQAGCNLLQLIRQAFKLKRLTTELPGIHIGAGLHAALRIDKLREYKPGDCEDFRHATTALPYYDAFCTEKSLRHLLCHKPLQYDLAYNTKVIADDDEIVALIDELDK